MLQIFLYIIIVALNLFSIYLRWVTFLIALPLHEGAFVKVLL